MFLGPFRDEWHPFPHLRIDVVVRERTARAERFGVRM